MQTFSIFIFWCRFTPLCTFKLVCFPFPYFSKLKNGFTFSKVLTLSLFDYLIWLLLMGISFSVYGIIPPLVGKGTILVARSTFLSMMPLPCILLFFYGTHYPTYKKGFELITLWTCYPCINPMLQQVARKQIQEKIPQIPSSSKLTRLSQTIGQNK